MYAIIEDSGKQLKVRENDTIDVDLRDLPEGSDRLQFDKVLLIGDETSEAAAKIGQPWLEGASVEARLEGEVRGDKITVVKFRRRKGYRRKQGHRQRYLRVTIDKINS